MKNYTIRQISELLSVPKDTLRYYDRIGLASPQRGENRYRTYTERDLVYLQYAEVMKYNGFSLAEIRSILKNMRDCGENNLADTLQILADKREELQNKAALLRRMCSLIEKAEATLAAKEDLTDAAGIDTLVAGLFRDLNGAPQ